MQNTQIEINYGYKKVRVEGVAWYLVVFKIIIIIIIIINNLWLIY